MFSIKRAFWLEVKYTVYTKKISYLINKSK